MPSIADQKMDLRHIIHSKVETYLIEHPERTKDIAMGAIRRLSGRMTLNELRRWHTTLFLPELIGKKE